MRSPLRSHAAAPGPCTRVSAITMWAAGYRACRPVTTSPRAAASAPVTTPTARGKAGSARLRSAANSPSEASARLRRSIAARWSPIPIRSIVTARKLSVALGGVHLGLALDEHALAVGEGERETVEAAALDRRAEARATRRIPEREEDERPCVVPAKLDHLALDPERRESAQVDPDAFVERGDAEDLAVAVERCLDLHPARVNAATPRGARRRAGARAVRGGSARP